MIAIIADAIPGGAKFKFPENSRTKKAADMGALAIAPKKVPIEIIEKACVAPRGSEKYLSKTKETAAPIPPPVNNKGARVPPVVRLETAIAQKIPFKMQNKAKLWLIDCDRINSSIMS